MMEGTYCYCIESTLAGVTPKPMRGIGRRCQHCKAYSCNAAGHHVGMAKVMRDRLRAAPYYRLGKRHERFIRKKVRDARIAYLKTMWAAQDALEAIGTGRTSAELQLGGQ